MIVVAGHICLDIAPELGPDAANVGETFKPGLLLEIGPARLCVGGVVANTGVALHQLGIPVRLIGKVGDDVFGRAILETLSAYDSAFAQRISVAGGEQTSYTIVISRPNVDRMFLHYPGANDSFSADDIDYDLVSRARIFHFGYPPAMKRIYENEGAELGEIFRRVKARGVLTSLDMVMPDPSTTAGRADWRSILKNVLPLVDIFLPSIEEILLMLEPDLFHELAGASDEQGLTSILSRDYFSQIAEQLLQMGASIVGLKAGNRGLYLRTGDLRNGLIAIDREAWSRRELWAPCFKVDVVCTSGAGDATVAGFLAGLVHGLTPAQVLTAAVATGACKVKSIDTVGDIVSWRELQEQIAAGWDRVPLNIEGTGWRFDERESVWEGQHDFGITPVGKATTELQ